MFELLATDEFKVKGKNWKCHCGAKQPQLKDKCNLSKI